MHNLLFWAWWSTRTRVQRTVFIDISLQWFNQTVWLLAVVVIKGRFDTSPRQYLVTSLMLGNRTAEHNRSGCSLRKRKGLSRLYFHFQIKTVSCQLTTRDIIVPCCGLSYFRRAQGKMFCLEMYYWVASSCWLASYLAKSLAVCAS